jgi:hypothetical protein
LVIDPKKPWNSRVFLVGIYKNVFTCFNSLEANRDEIDKYKIDKKKWGILTGHSRGKEKNL